MDTARDIAIVILALFNIIQAIIISALAFALWLLVRKVLGLWPKVEGIIDKVTDTTGTVSETAHTVSTTTTYVAGNVVTPLIKLIAFVAAVRQVLLVLLTGPTVPESEERGQGA